ncbi:TPA: terminase large subunit [Enterococcus faecalis]|uniref:terminase TerL endonuclease subunit n=1 Tax=Enterococcus faecalis TaxID=1351 RepID=UPI001156C984|nr:terminase TerL endonuclease subunit [Enterococcus faecalis]EKZ0519567.1 terminase large subunit [Enterococcus faecalis]MCO5482156.1 terminase large subunit [Enterococcus faecalis]MZY98511.1 terminase large subunit [Enterococcus faecalis]NSR90631.1 terminase large subunit [Enterococcus faecalis]NSV11438.1 terminase large subunit [Enterococcus faecalis]
MLKPFFFEEYVDLYERGIIPFNKERIQLVEYLKKEILIRDDIYFDEEMLQKYVLFSEKNFFPLAKYQKFISPFLFLYSKEDNEVFFDEILITIARGGGKNGFMSTRDAFFISPLYGISNYDVTITANSEKQGKVSFKEVSEMVTRRRLEANYYATKQQITNTTTNSVFSYRTNNPKTMDSARDGALEFDEIHMFPDSKTVDVQRSGLGKIPHQRTFYNGTNGHYREGFYDKIMERSDKILTGKSKNDRLFPFICKLDSLDEMNNPKLWSKANPMFEEETPYAKRLFSTVYKEFMKLEEEPSGRREFVVKRMNFTEGDAEADVATYDQLLATNKTVSGLEGRSCVAGFDYASIRDFASVGLLFDVDGKFIWKQHSFARKNFLDTFKLKAPIKEWEEKGLVTIVDEPSIDPQHLIDWLNEQRSLYSIELVCADGFRMDLLKPLLEKNGYEYEFLRNPRGVQSKIAPIIEDGFANERFVFGDDPMMRWYTNNTYVKEDKLGNRTFLKKESVRRKTDGFHAFLAALYKREAISEYVDYSEAFDILNELDF